MSPIMPKARLHRAPGAPSALDVVRLARRREVHRAVVRTDCLGQHLLGVVPRRDVGEQQPLRAGHGGGAPRLGPGQVQVRRVRVSLEERRLAQEQVSVARGVLEPVADTAVARVGQGAASCLDA